jgi:hypothetical protein
VRGHVAEQGDEVRLLVEKRFELRANRGVTILSALD